ncbi:bifunctional hydroxymethylpyrimidine kinase/phosphomethylpyrimidine kinase [Zhihengliuella halotolerans]|uniref:Hydroxymethylpyrimidine/phosphomethylpyrimidine kinase n=1 Tax=Zhihengliuella halotolerans TaxID=370736 RepID=A0A4Q8AHN0_9MICC|nr:bifunctional hydroxymethylpyrimidine kinase/phosphomethylpyrimidine kinase [Zhihengliuella halotolerans]RZU63209.1 hydroxymethylpyrimidine/phosphomethylpyrimidine kinase [Zhihengliuella halotolerans]
MSEIPNVLSIAGSDPSGGAGIQADLKSIAACGGYGMAALTALTAQNTRGVTGVHLPPADFVTAQLDAIADDVRVDAVKIGMLANVETIEAVGAWLAPRRGPGGPAVVLDPVMVATSGDRLTDDDTVAALRYLVSHADLVTPNLPELAVLLDTEPATTWPEALEQAQRLAQQADVLVLAKGGHLAGHDDGATAGRCPDALVGLDGVVLELDDERVDTTSTHGTGCSLSSAMATLYARFGDWPTALRAAKGWLTQALRDAADLDVGSGHGPVGHLGQLWAGKSVPDPRADVQYWWDLIEDLRARIDDVWFVKQLADGTLERADFEHYLAQDSIYLRTYSKVLSRAAQLAPTLDEQQFWANSASECLAVELGLHQARLAEAEARGETPTEGEAPTSAETRSYLNHLLSAAAIGSYAVVAAAVLPCYWLYQDIGTRLAAANRPDHPYADWLGMYSSPEFDAATQQAIAITQRLARQADPREREAMLDAYLESSRQEMDFFAQRRP